MAVLASLNRHSEDIVVKTVVITELKFCDVKRQILGANLVERADDTALENAPKAFNRLGVNGTDNVLTLGMVNGRVREFYAELIITSPLIGAEQANLVRHGLINERLQRDGADVLDHASDNVAFAAH